jgi:hypothetical protein
MAVGENLGMGRSTLLVALVLTTIAPAQDTPADGFPLPPGAVRRFGNRQMRHPTDITAVAVSPDGKFLATGSHECIVVWDLKTLTAKRVLPRGVSFGSERLRGGGLWFLPDNRSLLVNARQHDTATFAASARVELAQVWDVETGQKKFGVAAT